jgi:hypothetical protein
MAQERANGADTDLEGKELSDQMLLPIEAIGRGELWSENLIIFIRLRFSHGCCSCELSRGSC